MQAELNTVWQALITALVPVVSAFGLWAIQRVGAYFSAQTAKIQDAHLRDLAASLVGAAEQQAETVTGKDKLAWVVEHLLASKLVPTPQAAKAAAEGAVFELKGTLPPLTSCPAAPGAVTPDAPEK